MNGELFKDGHLSEGGLADLKAGNLADDERTRAAGHIAGCPVCADALARLFDEETLMEAPFEFERQVKGRMQESVRRTKMDFALYSLRVAAAACIALFVLFSGAFNNFAQFHTVGSSLKAPDFSVVDSISSGLRNFTQIILNRGGLLH